MTTVEIPFPRTFARNQIMKSSRSLLMPLGAGALLLASLLLAPTALQAASTDPVGYTTITLTPASGANRGFTVASFPLTNAPVFAGSSSGVGTNTITATTPGWTAGQFSPVSGFVTHVVVIFTGNAAGRTLPILSNTTTQLTVSLPSGISNLGSSMAASDQFRIIPVNTLNDLFSGVVSSANWQKSEEEAFADIVYLWEPLGSTWVSFWYKADFRDVDNDGQIDPEDGAWISSESIFADQGRTPIYPDEAAYIARRLPGELKMVIDGSVPVAAKMNLQVIPPTSGQLFSFIPNPYPKAVKLKDFQFTGDDPDHTAPFVRPGISGWAVHEEELFADVVYVWNAAGSTWISYWYNPDFHDVGQGAWVSSLSIFSDQGNTEIPANSGVYVRRRQNGNAEGSFASVVRPFTP